jgi:hypothetical protein
MRRIAWPWIALVAMLAQGCGALIGIQDVPPPTDQDASPGGVGGSQESGGSPGSGGTGGVGGTGGASTGGGGSAGVSGNEEEGGMATGGAAGSPMSEGGADAAPAILEFEVGTGSPTPPNPDDYGTQGDMATHHYTLKNVGGSETSAITLAITGNLAWEVVYEQGDCEQGVTRLSPGDSCVVTVIFHAGTQSPGDFYNATLTASATAGGKTTNGLKGKIARHWVLHYNGALIGSAVTGAVEGDMSGIPCTVDVHTSHRRQMFSVPNGIQVQLSCTDNVSCSAATYCVATNPTAVRQCTTTTTLGTYWESNGGCVAMGGPTTRWVSPESIGIGCDTNLVNLVQEYACE